MKADGGCGDGEKQTDRRYSLDAPEPGLARGSDVTRRG